MTRFGWQDAPRDVRDQVQRLVDALRAIVGDPLVGIYLHGSLAMGCFNPARSDVDLLAVTRGLLPSAAKRGLVALLLELSGQPAPLEISFLAHAHLHPWRHPAPFDLHYSEDWRTPWERAQANGDWGGLLAADACDADLAGHVTVVRSRGIVLCGPPIAEVFPPVPRQDYLASVLADVLSPEFGLDAAPGSSAPADPVYVVLNACRTLAYLATGRVLSKEEGGRWALQALPRQYHPVIAAMLATYRSTEAAGSAAPDDLQPFIAYARAHLTDLLATDPAGAGLVDAQH
jgi:streptomycin 3"-adenylyltransferase